MGDNKKDIPDRIWLQWFRPDEEWGPLWCEDKINENDVEYVQAWIHDTLVEHHRDHHKADEWISVEDRLPDVEHAVLAWAENWDKGRWEIMRCYYSTHYEPAWCFMSGMTTEVTHWRPLPDPPPMEKK